MPLISCVQSIPTQYKDLIGIRCEFDVGQYGEQEFVQYGVYREPTLHSAVDSRCAEFIAGRYVAARALSELGGADADTYIGIGNQRCPVWPSGTVGSISHSRNVAVAFVSSSNH